MAGAPIDPNSTSADRPLGMSLDETQFAIADWHGERVVFYDATDGKELRVWPYHTRGLNWSPDGKYLAVARGATVQLIDPQTFAVHAALRHAGLPSAKMLFTPDATRVVSVGSDGVRVFRVADGALLAHFPLDCWGLVVSGDGRHALACEGEKRLARTCRLPLADAPELAQTLPPADAAATGSRLLGQLPAHNVNVECIALSRDGSTFCTGSEDVCVWDVAGALGKRIASPSGMSVADLAMSDDGKRLAVRYYGHSDMPGCIVQVHDKDTGRTLAQTAAADKIVAMALAPDGNWALAACDDDRLLYMDAATGEVILRCMLPFKVSAMAVSPDARTLAIAGAAKYALMDATTGEVARTLSTKEGDARALLFSSDGTRLLSLNEPNAAGKSSVALLDTVKGKQLRCYRINSTLVLSHAWWPGEQFFLTGEYDGNLDIWSVEDTKRRGRIRSKIERMFRTIAPLPDGRVLAGGDMPGGLSVWQVVVPV